MNVAIVKYNAGNVYSVVNALRRLGIEPVLTDDAEQLRAADKVLFPGQGEASGAMAYLKARRLDEHSPYWASASVSSCCAVTLRRAMWTASACLMRR